MPDLEAKCRVQWTLARVLHLQISVLTILGITVCAPRPAVAQLPLPPPPLEDHARAVECLALAVAHEAGYESLDGQRAVAEVVLNRVRSPAFPKSICDVVFAGSTRRTGCQFTFTCDGSMRRRLPERIIATAHIVAEQAIDGLAPSLVFGATHYHAAYVSPYWAPHLVRLTRIGAHIFYRGPGESAVGIPGAMTIGGSAGTFVANAAPDHTKASAPPVFAPWGLAPSSIALSAQ